MGVTTGWCMHKQENDCICHSRGFSALYQPTVDDEKDSAHRVTNCYLLVRLLVYVALFKVNWTIIRPPINSAKSSLTDIYFAKISVIQRTVQASLLKAANIGVIFKRSVPHVINLQPTSY